MPDKALPSAAPRIQLASTAGLVTVFHVKRTLTMHMVSETELETIASPATSLNSTFFGLCGGALIGFFITLKTVALADPLDYAMFVALTGLSGVGTLYFGLRGIADYRASKRKLAELKRGTPQEMAVLAE